MTFEEFVSQRSPAEKTSTDEVLAAFLPLLRQVIATHRLEQVAPLEGIARLQMTDGRLWFAEADRSPKRSADAAVARVESAVASKWQVVDQTRRTTDLASGAERRLRDDVAQRGAPVSRPVYLPGYVSWEHELGCHDPLTDAFSLGLILATLALPVNLNEPSDLIMFVEHRRNLFAIDPQLHPIVAQVILRLTELDRSRRPRDLEGILSMLEHPGERPIDFEIDLARTPGFDSPDSRTRTEAILARLRDRLFDFSRRNNLLSFRTTQQTVNLTVGSMPLRIDLKNIDEEQILVWNQRIHRLIVEGKPINLGRYVNLVEAAYLPAQFDGMIAAARRDNQEYGFAQLRLVTCFLSWTNLKKKPAERFLSPLALLPVRLIRNNGVRDTYTLEPLSATAEVNPVVRRQFQQLYGISLPESVDLATSSLDELFQYLSDRIGASEPAVVLSKLDRPRIDLIHEKARKRLDQYRKSARISGRGVREFLDLDYSYDPANYHPLGLRLFSAWVRKPTSRLEGVVDDDPEPPRRALDAPAPAAEESERIFAKVRDATEENPYLWNFDLCNLTLANFRYRRMSLVQDYEAILQRRLTSAGFEATFAVDKPALPDEPPAALDLPERFDVVACDPTQAAAIALARQEQSFIIQGPPGTGKSQTITNLIADCVARGKRVLFVCEKRAAIDVVYSRLKQAGLGPMCSLIHDSQTDKREFIFDLKETYEGFQARAPARKNVPRRKDLLEQLRGDLATLKRFESAMRAAPAGDGLCVRELLDRCIQLRSHLPRDAGRTADDPALPSYWEWWAHRGRLGELDGALRRLTSDGVFARHPLRRVSPSLAASDRPQAVAAASCERAAELLERLQRTLERAEVDPQCCTSLERISALLAHLRSAAPLSTHGNMSLVDPNSPRTKLLAKTSRQIAGVRRKSDDAKRLTAGWRDKLSAVDAQSALELAARWDRKLFAWTSPAWWRLRSELRRRYDFASHAVRPSWKQILTQLVQEHAAAEALDACLKETAVEFGEELSVRELETAAKALRERVVQSPEWLREFHERLCRSDRTAAIVDQALAGEELLRGLEAQLANVFVDFQDLSPSGLRAELEGFRNAMKQLPLALEASAKLQGLPEGLGAAVRRQPWTILQLEAVLAQRTWQEFQRTHPEVERFDAGVKNGAVQRLAAASEPWQIANSRVVRDGVRNRFREKLKLIGAPSGGLSPDEKATRQIYTKGRRGLEHEFGKTMRFKAIRELIEGETGPMIRDLKPVWLMSPLSVSDTLPLDPNFVDVVVFDEASQIPLEEAIPTLFRGRQAVVVGDEKQLPPTDFFGARSPGEEEEESPKAESADVGLDLPDDSFLRYAARTLPATMLEWHYRSRSESLIAFSNQAFYSGRLLTVPDQAGAEAAAPASLAGPSGGVGLLLDRPVSFHLLADGVYEKRRNRREAELIAELADGVMERSPELTIGVIAFSEAQQAEIEAALERRAEERPEFRERLEAERERECDGQFVGLLVKNLENIQGDERDVVIASICYGPNPAGKVLMNFGPINRDGGERRLNVAFSRAKRHMAVVSSIRAAAITNDYNPGAACLKRYLAYAEAISTSDAAGAARVLASFARSRAAEGRTETQINADAVVADLGAELRARGCLVDCDVGASRFRVDLAVRRPEDRGYRLGILVDAADHYAATDAFEREVARPRLLQAFGWTVASVLARDWYEQRDAEIDRIVGLLSGPQPADEPAIEGDASPSDLEPDADEDDIQLPQLLSGDEGELDDESPAAG